MASFIQEHVSKITGMISGWDRLRFRGTVRMLANVPGLRRFLQFTGRYLLKDFGGHAEDLSRRTRAESLAVAEQAGRPVVHLQNPGVCKEEVAREIQRREGVGEGLICVLTAVEPCWSYNIRSNPQAGKLELVRAYRKCQHLYHYYQHPVLGFMHLRLQTWLPFNVFACVNGREWLGRQMDAAGIKYLRRENCYAWVQDVGRVQELLSQQVHFNWSEALEALVQVVNPAFAAIRGDCRMGYYWSLEESEWASDIMFKDQAELSRLYGRLLRHGMESLGSSDVLRFLGHKVRADGRPHGNFAGEVLSDLRERAEGIRIKHRVGKNSVKMYNKQGTVLRVETTLNDMRDLRAPRMKRGRVVWERMRKGVADIQRRAEVSQAANERYLEALAAAENPVPLKMLTEALAQPVVHDGRRARGLNLLGAADARLLQVVGDGKFLLNGFRNKDLQVMLFAAPAESPLERRRRSGQVTRKLWLLRAHGLIRKVAGTHRYLVTAKGRQLITALQAAREADVTKLIKVA
jgi:hypothetical protein